MTQRIQGLKAFWDEQPQTQITSGPVIIGVLQVLRFLGVPGFLEWGVLGLPDSSSSWILEAWGLI
jgi:hypothetical protein